MLWEKNFAERILELERPSLDLKTFILPFKKTEISLASS